MCPDRFLYLTVLRDPVKRIESNCRYEHIQPADALLWLTNVSHFPEETRVYEGTAAVDNFYVRTLCGPGVFHAPVGSLTRAHLEEAKRRLLGFEALLILEEYDAGLVQLEHLLGWKRPQQKKDQHRSFGPGDVSITFSPAQRRVLEERNQLDVELYAFARERSRAITAALVARGAAAVAPKTWAQAYAGRTTRAQRDTCQAAFGAWERDEKRRVKQWIGARSEANWRRRHAGLLELTTSLFDWLGLGGG